MGNILQFPQKKREEHGVDYAMVVERYQFFQFKGYPDTYRIVWVNKKPVRAEVLAPKDGSWVQLQRYKEIELINTCSDWENYG